MSLDDHDAAKPGWASPWLLGIAAGCWAALTGYAFLAAPVLLAWAVSDADGGIAGPLRVAGQAWLVTAGAEVTVGSGQFGLRPLLLSLALAVLAYRGGAWSAHLLVGGSPLSRRRAARLVLAIACAYGASAAIVAVLSATPSSAADPVLAGVSVVVPVGVAAAAGVLRAGRLGASAGLRLPGRLRVTGPAALLGISSLIAGGALLVSIALLAHVSEIAAITRSLDAGVVGGLVVTLGGAAYLGNAVVWAVALAAGPGFSLGAGTTISAGGSTLGVLPGLPVLGAVPAGLSPAAAAATFGVPLLAGLITGVAIRRRRAGAGDAPSMAGAAWDALAAGLLCGLGIGVACVLASGAAGADLLAGVGAVAWQVGFAVFAEVGLVAAAVAAMAERRLERRQASESPAGPREAQRVPAEAGRTG